jgi:hypothetical protein
MIEIETSVRVRVSLLAWGFTRADIEHAVDKAMRGEARKGWDFVDVTRLDEVPCPLNIDDGRALAAEQEHYWAYVVYPVWSAG